MNLSPRERWIAIGAGVVIGALALDSIFVTPMIARLDAANAAVQRGQEEQTEANQLFDNRLRAQRRWRDMTGSTLKVDAPAAEGQLLNRVRDLAQAAGLTLDSLKPERSERAGDFQRLSFRATGTGTMRQTSTFLDSLRTASIPIRVNEVQMTSRKDGADDLALQVALSTIYLLPPETKPEGTR